MSSTPLLVKVMSAYLALVFILSGLVVNMLQLLSLVLLRPWNRLAFRRWNAFIVEFYWSQLVGFAEWWAGFDLHMYSDRADTFPNMVWRRTTVETQLPDLSSSPCTPHSSLCRARSAPLLSQTTPGEWQESRAQARAAALLSVCSLPPPRRRSDLDWLLGWVIASKFGVLGGAKCLLKKQLIFVPVLGWSWWFLEYIFLSRKWFVGGVAVQTAAGGRRAGARC